MQDKKTIQREYEKMFEKTNFSTDRNRHEFIMIQNRIIIELLLDIREIIGINK